MPPMRARAKGFSRSESVFHQNLTTEDREELLKLQTLRDIPKSKYATQSCLTGIPSGRSRKIVYSHVEIYKNVEEIATDLREAGVRPQTACAFILHNSIEAVVYFQALQWIGAIAIPIDPDISENDIASVLRITKAFTVVSKLVDDDEQATDPLFQKIKSACRSVEIIEWYISRSTNKGVFLDRKGHRAGEGAAWAGGAGDFKYDPSETSLRLAIHHKDIWLAVDVTHRSITTAIREFSNAYNLTAEMSTLLIFPFHSVHGMVGVLASMYSGGNVAIREGTRIEVENILKLVTDYKVNWFSADSDTIVSLYEKVNLDSSLLKNVNLSFIRSVDGTIPEAQMKYVEPTLRTPVLEAYGTSETCGMVSASKEVDFRPGACGQAVHGCEIVILDASGKIVSAKTVGRIAVRGVHICREYIENDSANTERFVNVEKGDETKTYFLTGDEGYLSTDGYLSVTSDVRSRRKTPPMVARTNGEDLSKVEDESRAEDARKKIEEEEKKLQAEKRAKEAEKRRLEEDEQSKREAAEKIIQEEREKEEARLQREQSEVQVLNSMTNDDDEGSSAQNASRSRCSSQRSSRLDEELFNLIMERLDGIERNQRRLEVDVVSAHRAEMERLRTLLEKYEQHEAISPKQNVNMDAINSAVNAAAASAQSSSRDTAAAAQAAKDAAEAAAAARAATLIDSSPNVVEVADPDAVQKTVLVTLEDVEKAMNMHPAVAMSRAFGRPDKKYGMEVFCAINPKPGARVSEPWLKLHAQTVLAAAFVPKKFFYKEDLTGDEKRATLSNDMELKRMSAYAGFKNASKVIKQPEWTLAQGKEALAAAARSRGRTSASPVSKSRSGRRSGSQPAVPSSNNSASAGVA